MSDQEKNNTPPKPTTHQRIVVGFDVLAETTNALEEALAFATLVPKTHVEVVWVPPMAYIPGGPGIAVSPLETLNERVKSVLQEFGTKKLESADVRVSAIIGEGRPAQAISRIAFMHEAHMIIVGSHDKATSLEKFLLGSVAKRLVSEAPCPVLVMRPRSTEAVPEIEKPLAPDQARRRIGTPHRYRSAGRNVQAKENLPLLFPMGAQ